MVIGDRTPDGLRGYVNGIKEVSADTTALGAITFFSGNNWYIGFNERNTAYCGCTLDDVRIYNRALSADEIKRLYNLGGTVKLNTSQNLNNNNSLQNGLVGWWTFDGKDMSVNRAFDKHGQLWHPDGRANPRYRQDWAGAAV
jgi:hypothetical protein